LMLAVVYLVRDTLLVFAIALMLAYLLYPLMDLIDQRLSARTRTPALAITFLLVISAIGAFGAFIGSVVVEQANNLAKAAPAFLDRLRALPAPIQDQARQHYGNVVTVLPGFTLRVLSASRNLIFLAIVPILSFFILKDGRQIRDSFLEMFSENRQAAENTLLDAHTLLLQYMRALFLLCLATFISFSVVLSLMGVPYAILLASIAFPLEFVPLVGPMTAAAIVIAVTLLSGYHGVVWVIAFLGVYRLFQDYVLSPNLMSKGVELHPLMVIFGVFAGGEIGGVAGVFLSVPILALLRLLYYHLRKTRVTAR